MQNWAFILAKSFSFVDNSWVISTSHDNNGKMLAHVAFPNARYKQPKLRADASMSLCGAAIDVNWATLWHWKHWIMSCPRVKKHTAALHSETCSVYIYLIKSQTLTITLSHIDFCFILINCAALTCKTVTRSVNYSLKSVNYCVSVFLCELVGKKHQWPPTWP